MTDPAKLITVASYPSSMEAEMARGRLDSVGIRAFLHDDHFTALHPHMADVRVAVAARDAVSAAEFLGHPIEPDSINVYRRRQHQALNVGLTGGALAFGATLAGGIFHSLPIASLVIIVGGAIAGATIGSYISSVRCSNTACQEPLDDANGECPGCGRPIVE